MTGRRLEGIRACVFDAYGTLFDYASAAARCRDVLGDRIERLTVLWRDKQLQYAWLRTLQGRHADFWQVTGDALDFALDTLGIDDAPLRQRLMQCYLTLAPFPEVPATLERLKRAGLKTAILSNGTPSMLAAAVANAGIGELLDAVLSVEEAQVYKTHPKVYQLAVDRLASSAPPSASNRPTPGTPMRPPTSGCGWSGATATASAASDCREHPIGKSARWPNCPRLSASPERRS